MESDSSDALLGAMVLVLAIASIGTWFFLADRLSRGPILKLEPRRPVPWHGVWTLLPLLLVVLTVLAAIFGDNPSDDRAAAASELVERIALGSTQQLVLVVALMAVMIAVSRATRADLGLPRNRRELIGDVRIGAVAWLAALLPVYGVQFVLISIVGQAAGHPLIKMVEEHANPALFLLAFAAAVVVAPFCEELMFRLLLQGWLEKWEDARLGWRTARDSQPEAVSLEIPANVAPTGVVIEAPQAVELVPIEPPQVGIGGLPYGWLPIGASSLLFALAHVGYGPDPIPLFLLALIMGYVYQRTHRIVPSMVTHALFNGMSLFALWRFMSAGAH
jgi:membrane protease YdiL (CAAX protease family)